MLRQDKGYSEGKNFIKPLNRKIIANGKINHLVTWIKLSDGAYRKEIIIQQA